MNTLEEIKLKHLILEYDAQDLFNYHINILDNTIQPNTINGLSVWSKHGNTHANIEGLENLYYKNNNLYSNFYKNKEIHVLSFTFHTLKQLKNKLKQLIG